MLRSSKYKEIQLTHRDYPGVDLGVLRVRRLMNEDHSREMLFYELIWSAIINPEKEKIKYDTSVAYCYELAEVDQLLKKFSNDAGPDPMIYLGKSRGEILASFRTAFCWMTEYDWDTFPEKSTSSCAIGLKSAKHLMEDEFSIISHSLGSRIVMDGMHEIAKRVTEIAEGNETSVESKFITALQNKQIPFYMMSNQIPLLEMGEYPPEVIGEADAYYLPDGEHYNKRLVKKTSIAENQG